MYREIQKPFTSIKESGYMLIPLMNSYAEANDAEIFAYNEIRCYTYDYVHEYGKQCCSPQAAYCITDDLESCFFYAKQHNLNILRVRTLSGEQISEDSMQAVIKELKKRGIGDFDA